MKNNNEDEWVAHTLPPDPLHTNLLGPVNDLMDKIEELWPIEFRLKKRKRTESESSSGSGPSSSPIKKSALKKSFVNRFLDIVE